MSAIKDVKEEGQSILTLPIDSSSKEIFLVDALTSVA